MADWSKQLLGLAASLAVSGSLLTFILALLKRRDLASNRREDSAKVYELGYRSADAWGRQLAQLVGPAAMAHHVGDESLTDSLWELINSLLCERGDHGWKLKPHPDFLAEARRELELTEGREREVAK